MSNTGQIFKKLIKNTKNRDNKDKIRSKSRRINKNKSRSRNRNRNKKTYEEITTTKSIAR